MCHTRADITFAAGDISQFMHSPNVEYMKAMFRILKYLKTSRGNDILISKNNHLRIEAYTNADWAGSFVDKKSTSRNKKKRSTSGCCIFVRGNLGYSEKQEAISDYNIKC